MSWLSKPSKKQLSERDALKIEVERLKGLEQYLNEQIDEKANQSFSLFQEVAQLEVRKASLQTEIDAMMQTAHQQAEQLAQQFIQNKKRDLDIHVYRTQQLIGLLRKRNEAILESRKRRGEKRIQQGKETIYNLEWNLKRLANNLENDIMAAVKRRPNPDEPLGPMYTRHGQPVRERDNPEKMDSCPIYKDPYYTPRPAPTD